MKITAGNITQYSDIDAGLVLQNVPWSITEVNEAEEEVVLLDGNQSFPLAATSDEIREFLATRLSTYQSDVETHEGAKELQAGLDNAGVVASEISGLEITA